MKFSPLFIFFRRLFRLFLQYFSSLYFFYFSIGHAEYIARTDLAISHLEPWRAEIPVKFFASRIRFQIRIDDLRALVRSGQAQIDNILGMYIYLLFSN